nr:uncharacterized protein LOC123002709 [Drosophila takahashii]
MFLSAAHHHLQNSAAELNESGEIPSPNPIPILCNVRAQPLNREKTTTTTLKATCSETQTSKFKLPPLLLLPTPFWHGKHEMSDQETELRASNASKPTPAGATKSKFTDS